MNNEWRFMYPKYTLFTLLILLLPPSAHADLHLKDDDLLADKNRFRLDTDVSYYNHHKSSVARCVKKMYIYSKPLDNIKKNVL